MASTISATNLQVIFIRHGEKVMLPNGKADPNKCGLSKEGWDRAFRIRDTFVQPSSFLKDKTSENIRFYAMQQKVKSGMIGSSIRPIETILPLADDLGLAIDSSFAKDEQKECVKKILQHDNKTVIVCWEHKAILDFYPFFGLNIPEDELPNFTWSSDNFSKIVVLNYDSMGALDNIQIRDEDNDSVITYPGKN